MSFSRYGLIFEQGSLYWAARSGCLILEAGAPYRCWRKTGPESSWRRYAHAPLGFRGRLAWMDLEETGKDLWFPEGEEVYRWRRTTPEAGNPAAWEPDWTDSLPAGVFLTLGAWRGPLESFFRCRRQEDPWLYEALLPLPYGQGEVWDRLFRKPEGRSLVDTAPARLVLECFPARFSLMLRQALGADLVLALEILPVRSCHPLWIRHWLEYLMLKPDGWQSILPDQPWRPGPAALTWLGDPRIREISGFGLLADLDLRFPGSEETGTREFRGYYAQALDLWRAGPSRPLESLEELLTRHQRLRSRPMGSIPPRRRPKG